jgi:hypothetical protein
VIGGGHPFLPPITLRPEDLVTQYRGRIEVYRPSADGDGTWELDVVYTFQDGAYRIIIDGPPLRKELAGHDPNDHADPQVDG